MDLFEDDGAARPEGDPERQPLAARMRPQTLDELVGQRHLLAPEALFRRMAESGRITSCIFYGPPSSGKTTLAHVLSDRLDAVFVQMNAVLDGVKELKGIVAMAEDRRRRTGKSTVLFVDEIHRWNRAQQDALLPHVESGLLTLIGATTENPFYALVGPLLSRCRMFELYPPDEEDVLRILHRAVLDVERGLGSWQVDLPEPAARMMAAGCGGDIRSALNTLEACVFAAAPDAVTGRRTVSEDDVKQVMHKRIFRFDRTGDEHYHYASAFIKSLRGSDVDASLYWLAALVESGEDPLFVFRRLLIFCSEDIGLADPHALPLVNAAHDAFTKTGMPEGWYFLGHATVYCAMAPKSSSVQAVFAARDAVTAQGVGPVPPHLKDRTASGLQARYTGRPDFSKEYKYPHAYPGHWVAQQYLPEGVPGAWFEAGALGWEKRLAEIQAAMRAASGK